MNPTAEKRPVIIAGNWKMHHAPEAARDFLRNFRLPRLPSRVRVLLFPPSLSLPACVAATAKPEGEGDAEVPGHRLLFGVQNIHWEESGAFTGEISAEMARAAGASHTLVGHSERRHLFGETDDHTARKARAAYRAGLLPVLCVGETLDERRDGRLKAVLLRQLDAVLASRELRAPMAATGLMLAYEPVWAIGTGETATPEDASAAHSILRTRLEERLGPDSAQGVPILYGGSVKPGNAVELLSAPEVDGVLVGGAALEADSFAAIAAAVPGAPE